MYGWLPSTKLLIHSINPLRRGGDLLVGNRFRGRGRDLGRCRALGDSLEARQAEIAHESCGVEGEGGNGGEDGEDAS